MIDPTIPARDPTRPRGPWRPIAIGVAALVLAGCQSTIAGSGHPAPGQAQPTANSSTANTEPAGDPPIPDLRGTATCEPDQPTTRLDGAGAIASVTVTGTGDGVDVTIELTKPPVTDREQAVGLDIDIEDLIVGVLFVPGHEPIEYRYDPFEDDQRTLSGTPTVDGSTIRFSVSAELLADNGEDWRWYAYNEIGTERDFCPPLPTNGGGQTTVRFPPL